MERFRDPLADMTDEDLRRLHTESPLKEQPEQISKTDPYELFLYDRYDWEGFNPDYGVIRLTRGYFAIVEKKDFKKLSKLKWCANVQYHRGTDDVSKVYAVRRHRNPKTGKSEYIYLHRYIAKAGGYVIVDHRFGLSLDCRTHALRCTDNAGNSANARRENPKGLKRGVEPVNGGKEYRAQIKVKKRTYRSKKRWPATPEGEEAAHQWYLAEHRKAHSFRGLPELGAKPNYPLFPPLKKRRPASAQLQEAHPPPF